MSMINAAAQQIIDRLTQIQVMPHRVHARAAERALQSHFAALGLAMLPVRWLSGGLDAYLNTSTFGPNNFGWCRANSSIKKAAKRAAVATVARNPDTYTGWLNAKRTAARAIWEADVPAREASNAAWRAARRKFEIDSADLGRGIRHMRYTADDMAEVVGIVNALSIFNDAAVRQLIDAWSPCIDAYEAGLFLYAIGAGEIICVPRPRLSIVDRRLHREDGPAVEWTTADSYWFWRGVEVARG